MYGWRARIGYVNPAPVEGPVIHFYQVAPPGVTLVATALSVSQINADSLAHAEQAMAGAVADLVADGVDYIVVAGEPVFCLRGPGGDVALTRKLQALAPVPVVANVTAAVAALHHLGVRRPALATPYAVTGRDGQDLTGAYTDFFAGNGFAVAALRTMGIRSNRELVGLPPYASYQFARDVFRAADSADGLLILCGRWAAMDHIERLEQDLGVPVVTSVQAWIWKAFRDLQIQDPIRGFGRLLAGR